MRTIREQKQLQIAGKRCKQSIDWGIKRGYGYESDNYHE